MKQISIKNLKGKLQPASLKKENWNSFYLFFSSGSWSFSEPLVYDKLSIHECKNRTKICFLQEVQRADTPPPLDEKNLVSIVLLLKF